MERYDETVGTKRRRGVRVELRDGEVIKIPSGQSDIALDEAARLAQRIEEAMRARGEGHAQSALTFTRGARSPREWLRALRAVSAPSLRTSAVPLERLLALLEDGAASADERAGAAVAALASPEAPPDVRARIRVAKESSASPKLRVALERIADGAGDEELEEILAQL